MKSPKDKAVGYTVVIIIAAIVLFVIISTIARQFMIMPGSMDSMPAT